MTTATLTERDWWLAALGRHGRRLARAVLAVFRRMRGVLFAGLDRFAADRLLNEALRRLSPLRWVPELRAAVWPVVARAVKVAATDELGRHAGPATARGILGRLAGRLGNVARGMVSGEGWTRVVATLRSDVAKALRTAVLLGKPAVDAVKRAAALFRPAPLANRAGRVGVTEAHTALNSGKDVARVELFRGGYINAKTWVSQDDERVRLSHQDADGQTVGINERFRVGGDLCQYPGDPGLPPHERIGCRCVAVSVRLPSEGVLRR